MRGKYKILICYLKQTESSEDELVITEEQKQEFYNVIDYNADKAAIAASVDLPKDVSAGTSSLSTLLLTNSPYRQNYSC